MPNRLVLLAQAYAAHAKEEQPMAMSGKVHFSSDMRGLEVLDGVAVPRRASAHMVGKLGDPDASILFEVRDDIPVCVEVVVKAKPDGRGLRGADLEGLNLNRLAEAAFLAFAAEPSGGPLGGGDEGETRRFRKG